ncbi:MAG: 2-phospho-L-lactate transferase [Anaerolineaceae bacterium]|nr:2-phospho-L-lactate transferase [Anaerolineaceae bacterium]
MKKIVALAGGVGGAKLAWGLAQLLSEDELSIIVNIGDDFEHLGLWISPDLDTVTYTLAGLANAATGWGRMDETWRCLSELKKFGQPDWFGVGDRDLALHLTRSQLMREGKTLTESTRKITHALGIKHPILPASNERVPTLVHTKEMGVLAFQEYFVKNHCQPTMTQCEFKNIAKAKLSPESRKALEEADGIIFCPSNPWVSISPILDIENVRQIIGQKPSLAVSPIIGGKTIKGPAAKMYAEMGIEPSALAVARHYQGLIRGMVIDVIDKGQVHEIERCGIIPFVTNTIMSDNPSRQKLAEECLDALGKII